MLIKIIRFTRTSTSGKSDPTVKTTKATKEVSAELTSYVPMPSQYHHPIQWTGYCTLPFYATPLRKAGLSIVYWSLVSSVHNQVSRNACMSHSTMDLFPVV